MLLPVAVSLTKKDNWRNREMRCFYCEGTGKFKKPLNEKEYDEVFDKYDAMGCFSLGECRQKALDAAGYEPVTCPKCNGTGEG